MGGKQRAAAGDCATRVAWQCQAMGVTRCSVRKVMCLFFPVCMWPHLKLGVPRLKKEGWPQRFIWVLAWDMGDLNSASRVTTNFL